MSEKFVALYDLHWGYERRSGHKVALHDPRALSAAMQFVEDFKPDHVVLGGDILDCGSVSHHNKGKPGAVEGLRIKEDAEECREELIKPLNSIVKGRKIYHIGNHEDWLNQLVEEIPALEGIIEAENVLQLGKKWEVYEQGTASKLGKLYFIHGDQLPSSIHAAKSAVDAYKHNVRFGHFHTYQVFTTTSAVEANGHTAVAIPCLAKKDPKYGKGAPNRWMQGFCWGYVNGPDGTFNDYVSVIVNGRFSANGKDYKG